MTKTESKTDEGPEQMPGTEDNTIAIQLVNARKVLGWSQNELHLRSGVSRESIKQYETGRNKPGAKEIRNLCKALGLSPNRLLFGSDNFAEAASPLKQIFEDYDPDDGKTKFKLTVLFNQLTAEERNAILTLIEPILISRKGEKQLRELLARFDEYDFTVVRRGVDLEQLRKTVEDEEKIKKQRATAKKKPE